MKELYTIYKRRARRLLYAAQGHESNYFSHVQPNKKKIIVGLAADYSNLGDVAITYAQTEFLKNVFPDFQIVDYPISQTFKHFKDLKSIVTPEDIITTVGGGNTGDLYDSVEHPRQFLIDNFPDNKFISFPQTVDFSDTLIGNHMLAKAKKSYQAHESLTLIAREKKSYEFYLEHFPKNEVLLYPDIVLYIDESANGMTRKNITLTFRDDKEKDIDSNQMELFRKKLSKQYDNIQVRDTHVEEGFASVKEREESLQIIWDVFRTSKIVITDRLHGMIFCAITNTPCIAVNNSNKKVQYVYEKWLNTYKNIEMVPYFQEDIILKKIRKTLNKDPKDIIINKDSVHNEFEKMAERLEEIVNE